MDIYEFDDAKFFDHLIKTNTNTNKPCDNCPNNPKNGGSGICNCILGLQDIYC